MQVKMYERRWHGIDLLSVPGAASLDGQLPNGKFFEDFYAMLARGEGEVAEEWRQSKVALGKSIQQRFFDAHRLETGHAPSILAVGAGRGYTEGVWAEAGGDVTFQDYSASSLDQLRQRFPAASYVTGDMRELNLQAEFDFITLITVDYCVTAEQLRALLARLGKWLKPKGKIIVVSCSVLSWRRLLGESVKHLTGHYRRQPALFWGYWQTPAGLARTARAADLSVESIHRFGRDPANPSGIRQVSFFPLAMPWSDPNLVMIFRRP